MTSADEYPGPGFRQAQKCGRIKWLNPQSLFNWIPNAYIQIKYIYHQLVYCTIWRQEQKQLGPLGFQ
jgi:hypothetical protein